MLLGRLSAVQVVQIAAPCIGERVVGFRDLLELLLRLQVVRVPVGMVFERELTVGCPDVVGRCLAIDAKTDVEVLLTLHLAFGSGYSLHPFSSRCSLSR